MPKLNGVNFQLVQMLEALAVGAVDFGAVGNTPPIFAQAADKDLSYVGYEVVPANSQALLIPANSTIKSIQDLKGKRIAVQKGSSAHELLAKVLQKAGLSWQDIQPVWLPLPMPVPPLTKEPWMLGQSGNRT